MIVDVHSHFVPRGLVQSLEGFRVVPDPTWGELLYHEDRHLGPLVPRLTEPALLLEDMDRFGIDVRAIATGSWLFGYWAAPELAEKMARATNDRLAEEASRHPNRLVALATVPLQDADMAVGELRRAVEQLGMRGVAVGTNVAGRYFDDPAMLPFLEAVQALDVPIFFHPDEVAGAERLKPYYLTRTVGNPHEATIALMRMVLGGILERLPSLKLCFPMGGGSFPYILGRIEHGWKTRAEAREKTPRPPMDYLRLCYFDTITHSAETLEFLLRFVSHDQLLLGTDYPWDMGEPEPGQSVRAVSGLDPAAREAILGGNAARLLRIGPA